MDRICIKGYKSFKELDINLNKINVLIGSNGSGKSNFLSFFEFLNRLYEQNLNEFVALNGGMDKILHKGSKVTENINANIYFDQDTYSFTVKKGDDNFVFLNEQLEFNGRKVEINALKSEAQIKYHTDLERGDFIKKYLTDIKKYHFHDTGKNSPFAKDSNIQNDVYYLYEKGDNLAAFLWNVQNNHPIVYKRILKMIQSIAPYFSDFYFHPGASPTIRLQWKDKYSSTVYGPSDLSDATLRFIALTTLFMQPTLPGSIIIDEPELGLHPFAIQKLAGMIKSVAAKGTQVIIATQSTDLVSLFEPQDVITVNQVNGETTLRRLSDTELSMWLDEYTLGDLWKQNIIKGGQPK